MITWRGRVVKIAQELVRWRLTRIAVTVVYEVYDDADPGHPLYTTDDTWSYPLQLFDGMNLSQIGQLVLTDGVPGDMVEPPPEAPPETPWSVGEPDPPGMRTRGAEVLQDYLDDLEAVAGVDQLGDIEP